MTHTGYPAKRSSMLRVDDGSVQDAEENLVVFPHVFQVLSRALLEEGLCQLFRHLHGFVH
jgi:hypothetical protein